MAGLLDAGSAISRAGVFGWLLLALLVAGCASAPPEGVAAERAVYAAFFAEARGARDEPVRVVGASDAAWFAANPMGKTDWRVPYLADLGGMLTQESARPITQGSSLEHFNGNLLGCLPSA